MSLVIASSDAQGGDFKHGEERIERKEKKRKRNQSKPETKTAPSVGTRERNVAKPDKKAIHEVELPGPGGIVRYARVPLKIEDSKIPGAGHGVFYVGDQDLEDGVELCRWVDGEFWTLTDLKRQYTLKSGQVDLRGCYPFQSNTHRIVCNKKAEHRCINNYVNSGIYGAEEAGRPVVVNVRHVSGRRLVVNGTLKPGDELLLDYGTKYPWPKGGKWERMTPAEADAYWTAKTKPRAGKRRKT